MCFSDASANPKVARGQNWHSPTWVNRSKCIYRRGEKEGLSFYRIPVEKEHSQAAGSHRKGKMDSYRTYTLMEWAFYLGWAKIFYQKMTFYTRCYIMCGTIISSYHSIIIIIIILQLLLSLLSIINYVTCTNILGIWLAKLHSLLSCF